MFENFVTFTELVKLSSNVFWKMREVNYSNKILNSIYQRRDLEVLEKVLDLIEDKQLIIGFTSVLEDPRKVQIEKWLEIITKAVIENSISIPRDNNLIIYSSEYGVYDFVKYWFESVCLNYPLDEGLRRRIDLALEYSAANCHPEIFKYLIERSKCKVCNKQNCSCIEITCMSNEHFLGVAARCGNLEIVKYLVERPLCRVCRRNCRHITNIHFDNDYALRWCAICKYFDIVKYLIERGANIHAENDYVLRTFVESGNFEAVKYLVEKGADIHALYNYSLKMAICKKYFEIIKYFIEKGADINFEEGKVLKNAIEQNEMTMVKFLIENGADMKFLDDGCTLIQIIKNNNQEMINYLKEQGLYIPDVKDLLEWHGYIFYPGIFTTDPLNRYFEGDDD